MNVALTQLPHKESPLEVHPVIPKSKGPYSLQRFTSKSNYKWWYFDIETNQGDIITIVFHENHMFCCNDLPSVSMSFYDGGNGWRKFYDSQTYRSEEIIGRSDFLKIGQSYISLDGETTVVELVLPRVKVSLRIRGTWDQDESVFRAQTNSFQGHIWQPILLGQPVHGVLEFAGGFKEIRGICYHDCNYGNGYLGSTLKRWFWGRSYTGEMKFAFLIPVSQQGALRGSGIFQGPDAQLQVVQIRTVRMSGSKFDVITGGEYFSKVNIDGVAGKKLFNMNVVSCELVDAKLKDVCNEGRKEKMQYYRIMSEWKGEICEQGQYSKFRQGGLTEQMLF